VGENHYKIYRGETFQKISIFCSANNIDNIDEFIYKCFKQGFDIKRYGFLGETEQEKIVEVPVEIIKEVEKIVEVPVEKVVTKIEYIRDENNENELGEKITKLEKEMSKKDEELDQLRRNLDIILDEPPVEIIKEVEKIVEVIKEVEVPNDKMGMLQETLQVLRKELQTKNERIKELEKINRDLENINTPAQGATYLRGSNINNRL
jgi:predicted RNase H-like nuclease (RuvC/YqgF family)